VLPGSAGVAVPTVVADVDQHLGPQPSKLPHLVGEDRLIADEDAVAVAIQPEGLALFAAAKKSSRLKGMYSPKGTR
jgi:hypothetical protein